MLVSLFSHFTVCFVLGCGFLASLFLPPRPRGPRYIECHEFVLHFFSAAFRLRSDERSAELNAQAIKEKAGRDAKKAAAEAEVSANFHILK